MIIFDDIVFSIQNQGGISRFWTELTKRIKAKTEALSLQEPNKPAYHKENLTISSQIISTKFARYKNYGKIVNNRSDKYIFHSSYYRISKDTKAVNILTIHDLFYERFSNSFWKKLHLSQKRKAIQKADHIVCVSEFTKQELQIFYPGINHNKISIIPNSSIFIDNLDFSASSIDISKEGRYFIVVGKRDFYFKGTDHVLHALEILPSEYSCIFVGEKESKEEIQLFYKYIKQQRVKFYSNTNDYTLAELIKKSIFLFFPSRYEGFGIPPLEALTLGTKVVTTNRRPMKDILGTHAIYFESDCLKSLEEALNQAIRPNDINIDQNKIYQPQSWDDISESYLQLYKSCLKSKCD